jgi:hypothetical protein
MKPVIEGTRFGSITVAGETYRHDVVIRLDGRVEERRKDLSRAVHGTSHTVSRDEVTHMYGTGAETLIVGTGQSGGLALSDEAVRFLRGNGCEVRPLPTPAAVAAWNDAAGAVIGLFHVTC